MAAEHVAEAHGGEDGGAAGLGQGLDLQLAQPLGGPHDVGGVDRLVGGDQDAVAAAELLRQTADDPGAQHVVLHGLTGVVLHERHVLVGRRVEDDLGPVPLEAVADDALVGHRADDDRERHPQLGRLGLHLVEQLVGRVLVDVEDDDLARPGLDELTDQLRADGATTAGDQDDLVAHVPHPRGVEGDLVTGEQLGDLDLPQCDPPVILLGQIPYVREGEDPQARCQADGQDALALGGQRRGAGQDDLLGPALLGDAGDVVTRTVDLDAVDVATVLGDVVIDQGHRFSAHVLVPQVHALDGQRTGLPGSDDEGTGAGARLTCASTALGAAVPQRPGGEASPRGHDDEQRPGHDVGTH